MRPKKFFSVAVALIFFSITSLASAGQTLDAVMARGFVKVGASGNLPGFGMPDSKGIWRGLDVDTGRAIAAAVFGDASKVKFIALTDVQRFTALQSGEIDVLCRNATHTLHRDTALGLNFAHPTFYDGQGFMVPKKLGVKSALELDGASICILPGTTTEMTTADFFRTHGMKYKTVVIENAAELYKAFFAGRCDCTTTDRSQLASARSMAPDPSDYIILPETITKEPLAPVIRQGDEEWTNIVNWSVYALIEAEELGITSKNVDKMLRSKDPRVQRFLGVIPGLGKDLGLSDKWAYNIIKQVGNYGEIFERNVGVNTPLGLKRGLNALWTNGGLMYSPPFH
ncbi:MAG: amino acid ABC transporter substrate-binding protein [Deltaproteobacteria bacterium]|nr:MAG: amino acid ABC transporter substrate-binding protein [Deltaproteobacteria bacterium]